MRHALCRGLLWAVSMRLFLFAWFDGQNARVGFRIFSSVLVINWGTGVGSAFVFVATLGSPCAALQGVM